MKLFEIQHIEQDLPWGARLRHAREEARWRLSEAAEELDIQQKYLEALETMNLRVLPGEVYARNFLLKYCRWLDVPAVDIVTEFQRCWHDFFHATVVRDRLPVRRVLLRELLVLPRILRWSVATICGLALMYYLGAQLFHITQPPYLEVLSPADDMAVREYAVRVEGVTEPGAHLRVNDERINPDTEGHFTAMVPLYSGVTVVRVEARQRLSRQATVTRRILLLEDGSAGETISQSKQFLNYKL